MKKYIALCILLTVAGAFLCVDMRTFELVKSIKSDFECQGFCYKIPAKALFSKAFDNFSTNSSKENPFSA